MIRWFRDIEFEFVVASAVRNGEIFKSGDAQFERNFDGADEFRVGVTSGSGNKTRRHAPRRVNAAEKLHPIPVVVFHSANQ